jgi:hypothetical protein
MSIFRTRSPDRDRDTDSQRFHRLSSLLLTLIKEMTDERQGLEARQRKTKDDAAFSLLALEEEGSDRISARVDQLTTSLILATHRLKALDDQIEFMNRLLGETIAFGQKPPSKPGGDKARLA